MIKHSVIAASSQTHPFCLQASVIFLLTFETKPLGRIDFSVSLLSPIPFSLEDTSPRLCRSHSKANNNCCQDSPLWFSAAKSSGKFLGVILFRLLRTINLVTLSCKMPSLQLTAKAPFSLVPLFSDWPVLRLPCWFLLIFPASNVGIPYLGLTPEDSSLSIIPPLVIAFYCHDCWILPTH